MEVFLYPSILQTHCSKYLPKRLFRLRLQVSNNFGSVTLELAVFFFFIFFSCTGVDKLDMVSEGVTEVGTTVDTKDEDMDEEEDFLDEYGNVRPAGEKLSSPVTIHLINVWDGDDFVKYKCPIPTRAPLLKLWTRK